jgi:hypothetical protein
VVSQPAPTIQGEITDSSIMNADIAPPPSFPAL